MGKSIGQMLPFAVGVLLSPMPVVAVILTLVTPKARSNGPAFLIGWTLGLAVIGGIVLAVAGPADASEDGAPATWVGWLKLVLGALLLLVAVKEWKARPAAGEQAEMPKWMGAIDTFSPPKSAGAAFFLAGINPKNLLLVIGGATAIAETGIPGNEQVLALVVFIIIASIGVATPVIMFFAMGEAASGKLQSLKAWMATNNALIMSLLCLVIGVKLVGDGISNLSA